MKAGEPAAGERALPPQAFKQLQGLLLPFNTPIFLRGCARLLLAPLSPKKCVLWGRKEDGLIPPHARVEPPAQRHQPHTLPPPSPLFPPNAIPGKNPQLLALFLQAIPAATPPLPLQDAEVAAGFN